MVTSLEERERRSKRLRRNRIAKELRENRMFLPKVVKEKESLPKKISIKDINLDDDV